MYHCKDSTIASSFRHILHNHQQKETGLIFLKQGSDSEAADEWKLCKQKHSHESVLPLTLLQRVLDESSQFYEEQLLRGLGRGPGAFGLTILFAKRLGPGVT